MQVQGLVDVTVRMIGDLTNLISGAVGTFGVHMINTPQIQIEQLTNGIFGTTDGLIYWMKNDLFYLVNNLGTPAMAAKLANFIGALIIGSGATAPANYPWF